MGTGGTLWGWSGALLGLLTGDRLLVCPLSRPVDGVWVFPLHSLRQACSMTPEVQLDPRLSHPEPVIAKSLPYLELAVWHGRVP